ncbi:MAG: hypothetical protein ACYSWW_17280, partial [Planctomycetota bacterium]
MTKASFSRRCERFAESRGNLSRYGGTFSTAPRTPLIALIDRAEGSILSTDEFYISVPNATSGDAALSGSGGFTYEYKYGRAPGQFDQEYVRRVPMSNVNLSPAVRERIKTRMPGVWNRLVTFSQKNPRTGDMPDS